MLFNLLFIGIGIGITLGLAVAAYWLLPGWFRGPSGRVSLYAMVPQHLNARVAERVAEANTRVAEARDTLGRSTTTLRDAEAAAAANRADQALQAAVQTAKQAVDRAQDVVRFEESQLDQLMQPDQMHRILDRINWATVLQYVIFAALAWFVLVRLLDGITSSPPAGTTPRSMITFLIAVVTVGIALILVLSTIVSNSDDREKRFSQGKEVLTALLGVLGTIVGFYFGTSQDQVKGFDFDPVVIRQQADQAITLSTAVHGGKAPYSYSATFTPSTIPSVTRDTLDGQIEFNVNVMSITPDTGVNYLISVRDAEGNTGSIASKQALRLKRADDSPTTPKTEPKPP